MKFQLIFVVLMSALLFTACRKEEKNCRDSKIGIYEGNLTGGGTLSINIKEGTEAKEVSMVFKVSSSSSGNSEATLKGTFDESCATLTIPKQSAPGNAEVNGTCVITDNKLKGSLTATVAGSVVSNQTFDLNKK